jgi:predicted PurR-regulated permease PerM
MKDIFRSFNAGRATFFLMVFICCLFAGAVLKIASSVILPFTIAILLAFVMYPLVKGLDKLHFPRYLSISVVVLIIVAGLYIFGMVLFTSGRVIVAQYPKYEKRLTEIYIWAAHSFGLSYNEGLSFWENLWGQLGIRTWVYRFTFSFSGIFVKFLQNAVLVVIFVGFILFEASYFKEKLEVAFANRSERINRMGHDLMFQVSRYLTAKFFISLVNGVIFAISFHVAGLEFAILWGVIQFLLNFIPTIGSIVAGAGICFSAVIQFWPDPAPIIVILAIVVVVNIIVGYIMDPKIIGDHVGISPLMIMISLLIWGWIWGFAGMLIAVPMTVIIKIACENIPIMEPVSVLIGSRKSVNAVKDAREKSET